MLAFIEELNKSIPTPIEKNKKLALFTTANIGGVADYFVEVTTAADLQRVITHASLASYPFFVLGAGSNVLIADKGVRGLVISTMKMNYLEVTGNEIKAGAGATMGKLAQFAQAQGLTGLEFASGIPGSVGGGIFMNAGAYGGSIDQVLEKALVLDEKLMLSYWSKEKLNFSYRHSQLMSQQAMAMEGIFQLETGDKASILEKMQSLNRQRLEKQPLEHFSAGSTFKRPAGHYAGKLIREAGLAGYTIGGAKVSSKHCGFIINYNQATASDMIHLMTYIKKIVYDMFQVTLEAEIEFVGDFTSRDRDEIKHLHGY